MRVAVLDQSFPKEIRAGRPIFAKSAFQPLWRWRNLFRQEGVYFSFFRMGTRRPKGFDAVIVSSRVNPDEFLGAETLSLLSRLRDENKRIIWFDQSDSTGTTQFGVMDSVDLYAKRHLLRNPAEYLAPSHGMRVHEEWLKKAFALETSQGDLPVPLSAEKKEKIRLSWTFSYSLFETHTRIAQVRASTGTGYLPGPLLGAGLKGRRASLFGAFFSGEVNGDVIRRARYLGREAVREVGGAITAERLSPAEFMLGLASVGTNVSPFGWGEMCHRDFEIAYVGTGLAKPSVDHLITFPHILEPHQTYFPLSWDPRQWQRELVEVTDSRPLAEGLHAAYKDSVDASGAARFVEHVCLCILSSREVCDACAGQWWGP